MNNKRYPDKDIEAIYRVIEQRRDMRHFTSEPIEPDLLRRLLRAAHFAPSVGFMQPWRFIRITDNILRQKMYQLVDEERIATAKALGKREDEFMKLKVEGLLECAEVLVVSLMGDRDKHVFGRRTLPEMDLASVSCAIQNIWLAARAEGIGVGWVSIFDPNKLSNLINIPEDGKPVAILCVGHVDNFYDKPMLEKENWAKRQELDTVIFENQWGKMHKS
ncbi:MAG: 5,6-dimethylbenzimidazole synthase [Gammaproteobacteria bacterium]|nr:5,6-dimethylbenzimidazole synthase [Gammaproteobacteria bacterium]